MDRAIEIRPMNHIAWSGKGMIFSLRGEYKKALHAYENALLISESNLGKEHPQIKFIKSKIEIIKQQR